MLSKANTLVTLVLKELGTNEVNLTLSEERKDDMTENEPQHWTQTFALFLPSYKYSSCNYFAT